MGKYNPYYWEISVENTFWDNISEDKNLFQYNFDFNGNNHWKPNYIKQLSVIKDIIANDLTQRQTQVMNLLFYKQLTQKSIAQMLCISQPTVSSHIMGKLRKGKNIGGAINKIKKKLKERSAGNISGIITTKSIIQNLRLGNISILKACEKLNRSKRTIYRYLKNYIH